MTPKLLQNSAAGLTNALDPLLSLQRIAKAHGLTSRDIRGRDRHRKLVTARRALAVALRGIGLTYAEVGEVMHRDHASVMNLVRSKYHREGA